MGNEEYVRSVWVTVDVGDDARGVLAGPWWVCVSDRKRWFYGHTAAAAWAASAEFTSERFEQVRRLRADIQWIQDCIDMSGILEPERGLPEQRRILARLESALADLTRGMKQEAL